MLTGFSMIWRAGPFTNLYGAVKQSDCFSESAEAFSFKPASAADGKMRARRERGAKCIFTEWRDEIEHVGTHPYDVPVTGFSRRVLQIDTVTEEAGFGPWSNKIRTVIKKRQN